MSQKKRPNVLWSDWIKPLLIIGAVMFSFRSSVADWNDVPTGSMKPTILEGDRIFINKIAYDLKIPFTTVRLAEWDHPTRGEIVVLRSPEDGKRLVKRVVGVPGDLIEIRNNRLLINHEPVEYLPIDEELRERIGNEALMGYRLQTELIGQREHLVMHHPVSGRGYLDGPFSVPEEHYFVMGDNRDNSRDSRLFGPVPREAILGEATAVALSLEKKSFLVRRPRWQRFFSALE